ncbi:excinuclease ABC subunit UvrC [Porphyromonas sp.]|uniref:excinuclease ABC subunit UvrC n=1 Tax=Porphyromonas sp. TaxID=1924944 RepID=UPI0026DDC083|nr:excinuclease ABC subunit UvrC [Porphyromonas sp.]MDO4770584.1 excinuclease ABC subunit UvrC [Porphyromonas sp.]
MLIPREHIRASLSAIPEKPGCYRYRNSGGEVIYVGKAKNLRKRISSYFQKENEDPKTRALLRDLNSVEYIVVETEHDALLLENNLIKEHQPMYNILLKEGNTYPWISVTREPFPRIFSTHKMNRDGSLYFGPYPDRSLPHTLIKLFKWLFKFRTCKLALTPESIKAGKFRVCLQYHIKRCKAPCIGNIPLAEYQKDVESAKKILNGNIKEVVAELKTAMLAHAERLEFEKAHDVQQTIIALENHQAKSTIISDVIGNALVVSCDSDSEAFYVNYLELRHGNIIAGKTMEYKKRIEEDRDEVLSSIVQDLIQNSKTGNIREVILPFDPGFELGKNLTITVPQRGDRRKVLDLSMENVRQYMEDKYKQAEKLNPEQRNTQLLRELMTTIGLPSLPYHIECFDNSNISGDAPVAACVVFKGAHPSKADYRHYHIRGVSGPDDYASMREVVTRRYSKMIEEGAELPDLIVTDGGKGHMNTVSSALTELGVEIPILGLAKDDKHNTANILYGDPPQLVGILQRSQAFHLLTRIQDEVHRFAIKFHRDIRSKKQKQSQLDDIKGIGAVTKKTLLSHFKSIKRMRSASMEELAEVIGAAKAKIIHDHFNSPQ